MNQETLLEIQANVDGELAPRRRRVVDALIAADPQARAWHNELEQTAAILRAGEPQARIAESREFYWSKIQRRLIAANVRQAKDRRFAGWTLILRWLAPVAATAAVAVAVQIRHAGAPSVVQANSIIFSSDSDGVTIHWLN